LRLKALPGCLQCVRDLRAQGGGFFLGLERCGRARL